MGAASFAAAAIGIVAIGVFAAAGQPIARDRNVDNWALDRLDQRSLPLDGIYNPPAAGAGANVYVIDSGVRTDHEEFRGRIHVVGNFFEHPSGASAADDVSDCAASLDGHGTHQASYAAGTRFGVAKQASIWVAKAANARCDADWDAVAAAVDWIAAHGARPGVVNVSWRPPAGGNRQLEQAVAKALDAGFSFTVSAGSEGDVSRYWSPTLLERVIVAAGTDEADCARVDAAGCATQASYGPSLTLFAPAIGTRSAGIARPDDAHTAATDADCRNGCDSYAAPHAAGVAALYLGRHPSAAPSEVRSWLLASATTGAVKNAGNSANRLLHIGSF